MKSLMFVFDRMPDQDGCTFVEVENESGESVNAGEWRLREDGLAELVVPVGYSQSFDEAQERELFEAKFGEAPSGLVWNQLNEIYITHFLADRLNFDYCNKWLGWKESAKSRAQQ